jgi:1,4-alpha-glucan branching enzyme
MHEDSDRMVELAQQNPSPNPLRRRALNQAARELLLAQSSDWAFIMKTGTMVEYARERTRVHVLNFNHLYEEIKRDSVDEGWLNEVERRHNIFPDIDYRLYA